MGIFLKCYKTLAEFIHNQDPSGKALQGVLHLLGWITLRRGFLHWMVLVLEPSFEAQNNTYAFGLVMEHLLKRFL